MNPNREGPVNFELPPQAPGPEQAGQTPEIGHEAPPARQEQVGKQAPKPALPVVTDVPDTDQPTVAAPADDAIAPIPVPAFPADDTDHIENQWVDKVKAIVATTSEDPYKQKNEMSRVKAQYIQKRFKKTIKTDNSGS
jgi:hypothetical protein